LRSIKLFLVAIALASPAHAITTELVAQGFSAPLDLVNARDGSHRLFVAEQGGLIRIVQGSAAAPAPFLDLSSLVVTGGERGLLGVAFHPDYRANGRFFVDYTRAGDGATVIAEYRVSTDPQRADPASARVLLVIPQPFENHNGGALRFGPDGLLYIGMGMADRRTIREIARRTRPSCSARSCASTSIVASPMASRPAIHSPTGRAGGPRSGLTACAIPGDSRSIARPATSSSATWGRARGRRSIASQPAPAPVRTSVGARWKGAIARALPRASRATIRR